MDAQVEAIVSDFLGLSVATHKRRVAIRQGRREPTTEGCDHAGWDWLRQWCNGCGVTKLELVRAAAPPPS